MPRSIDPESFIRVTLDGDRDKLNPPAFVFRSLSLRKLQEAKQLLNNFKSGVDLDGWEPVLDFIAAIYVESENLDREYEGAELANLLAPDEVVQLLGAVIKQAVPTRTDVKNFESPHFSSAAKSANPVEEVDAPIVQPT